MSKKGKTRLQREKEAKRNLDVDIDYLKQVELPENRGGGRKFIAEYETDRLQKEKKADEQIKNFLDSQRTARITYRSRIANYGQNKLDFEEDIPETWKSYCIATDGRPINIFGKRFKTKEGVLVILKSPKGNVYVRGITMTYEPMYDVKAIDILLVQVENTIDSEKGILLSDNKDTNPTLKKTKSGIYLPN